MVKKNTKDFYINNFYVISKHDHISYDNDVLNKFSICKRHPDSFTSLQDFKIGEYYYKLYIDFYGKFTGHKHFLHYLHVIHMQTYT